LILCGAVLLTVLRVKDSTVRLAAWTAMLCVSCAIPVLSLTLPKLPVTLLWTELPAAVVDSGAPIPEAAAAPESSLPAKPFDWQRALFAAWALVAAVLLLRVVTGLALSLRMRSRTQPTGQSSEGIEIRESDAVASPVSLGILRPVIVLPGDWRQWTKEKLDAVLAHERSHIQRYDGAAQLVSAIHRAVLWHTPASWLLHQRMVRVAEEVSDDAAIGVSQDRASYAQVLLEFMQRGVRWEGVPMARYGRQDARIGRILSGQALSRGVTRWSLAAILMLAVPAAYLIAAAAARPAATPAAVPAAQPANKADILTALGNVTPSATVTVRPRMDGQLLSVNFKEGEMVKAGQVLATLDPAPYRYPLMRAESQLAEHLEELARLGGKPGPQMEALIRTDQAAIEEAKLQLSYAEIVAPISGMAGLRAVDAGNLVKASDPKGIVVITQLQPIAVVFQIPEDRLPQVLARLRSAKVLAAEAWNRDFSKKLASGHVTAVDNLIDMQTGTAKVKAVYENLNGALFPNQFVNVRMVLEQ
jgi:multidrug efflux pump subunit AcrA (membrane-fusion protein)